MTDIEKKALALLNEVRDERGYHPISESFTRKSAESEALCRAIEQHEAFRQEVSDAVKVVSNTKVDAQVWRKWVEDYLAIYIIPAPKPDPLVEVMKDLGWEADVIDPYAKDLRAALEARGLEIRSKNDD